MLVGAAIRPNPQSALRKTRNRCRPSELELRWPRNGLDVGPRRSRRVHSAAILVQIPNLPAKVGLEG
eukprot:5150944-Alexandrium_andersonii.AAC.1